MPPIARLSCICLDAADPAALADFYRQVTGFQVVFTSENFTYLAGDGPVRLSIQRVPGQPRPSWPDDAKQFHLDFSVPDLDEAEQELIKLGAGKPEFQPGGDKWRVLTDPAGHPFCITTYSG